MTHPGTLHMTSRDAVSDAPLVNGASLRGVFLVGAPEEATPGEP